MTAPLLGLKGVERRYADGFIALGPLDLTAERGEILAILGPSGCGKSTLLRLLAGLDRPTAGELSHHGRPITGPAPDVGVVFQEPRLMPWLSVADNVALGLWDRDRADRARRVARALERVGLAAVAKALPKTLSGGMAQRVGIARAMASDPDLLLMDEPFGALDPLTRMAMQDQLIDMLERREATTIFITHDVDEALVVADRIVVLAGPPGRLRWQSRVDLPRPRDRTARDFQDLKRRLLGELDAPVPGYAGAHLDSP